MQRTLCPSLPIRQAYAGFFLFSLPNQSSEYQYLSPVWRYFIISSLLFIFCLHLHETTFFSSALFFFSAILYQPSHSYQSSLILSQTLKNAREMFPYVKPKEKHSRIKLISQQLPSLLPEPQDIPHRKEDSSNPHQSAYHYKK